MFNMPKIYLVHICHGVVCVFRGLIPSGQIQWGVNSIRSKKKKKMVEEEREEKKINSRNQGWGLLYLQS